MLSGAPLVFSDALHQTMLIGIGDGRYTALHLRLNDTF
jgi:hypothetical protein